MNPLKRIKLKSMLRNCDYILAGTVIKQQYYDHHRRVEVNHLIDQFMDDPGFEHALKLIAFNDMMVFYFTESCKGGLYVRKTELSGHTDHGSTRQDRESERESHMQYDQPLGRRIEEKAELPSAFQAEQRRFTGVTVYTADSEELPAAVLEPSAQDIEKSRQLLQLKESEEWMDQMIAKNPRLASPEMAATPREVYGESTEDSFTNFVAEPYAEPAREYFAESVREPMAEPYGKSSLKPLGASLDELFGKAAENPQPLGESFDEFLKQPLDIPEEQPAETT
ncbi:MAG TPA: hypothetical protein VGE40_04430, partial [Bacilli bacterium]